MQIRAIPQQRVIEKMDEYMSRRDYAGAERHLLYWLEEAKQGQDLRGQLMVRNELIGHFRKTGNRGQALHNVEEALHLLQVLDFANSISAGTTYVNAATACNAFGENERAMELFEKARAAYEMQNDEMQNGELAVSGKRAADAGKDPVVTGERSSCAREEPAIAEGKPAAPGADPQLLGGLYNNMALTCVALAKEALSKETLAREAHAREALSKEALAREAHAREAQVSSNTANRIKTGKSNRSPSVQEGSCLSGNTTGRNAGEWYDRAFSLYEEALEQMRLVPNGELEQAITYLNMADALEGRDGPEAAEHWISELLDTAYDLLQTPSVPRDGYYAFVCEKCAPTFSYYGYFLAAGELQKQAETIYARPG